MTAPPLPRVNSLVHVQVGGSGSLLPTRVEDRGGAALVVAAPVDPAAWGGRPTGSKVTLQWEHPEHGVCAVLGMVTRVDDGRIPTWTVRIDGTPRVLAGRTHDRVPTAYDVTVEQVSRRPPSRFSAVTLDIGLGGFRCRTEEWAIVDNGEDVRVRFGKQEPPVVAAGIVVRPSRVRNVLECSVSLRQPLPERTALLLRRLVRGADDSVTSGRRR
jgi:hypothetical protein